MLANKNRATLLEKLSSIQFNNLFETKTDRLNVKRKL